LAHELLGAFLDMQVYFFGEITIDSVAAEDVWYPLHATSWMVRSADSGAPQIESESDALRACVRNLKWILGHFALRRTALQGFAKASFSIASELPRRRDVELRVVQGPARR
jgi:hypothetical protein